MRISDWSSDVCSSDLRDCPTPVREHPWRRYAMAASVALAAFAGTVAYDHLVGRVSTERGEVRRIALEDGSLLTLTGDSAVQVRYEDDIRRNILRRGEASFEVAHNRAEEHTSALQSLLRLPHGLVGLRKKSPSQAHK